MVLPACIELCQQLQEQLTFPRCCSSITHHVLCFPTSHSMSKKWGPLGDCTLLRREMAPMIRVLRSLGAVVSQSQGVLGWEGGHSATNETQSQVSGGLSEGEAASQD